MPEKRSVVLPREQLYREIWEISVSGVAKKYDVPYNNLLKECKNADIPIPPSGYWVKLDFGKPVTQTPLPDSAISEVAVSVDLPPKRAKRSIDSTVDSVEDSQQENSSVMAENVEQDGLSDTSQDEQLAYRLVTGRCNTYNREKLYKEVWEKPVVDVALDYGVSDVAIHKICKTLKIPVPPRGYWAKVRAGAKLRKNALPVTKGPQEITGVRTFEGIKDLEIQPQMLAFLTESEREMVLLAAQQIRVPESAQLHKKIVAYKAVINEWNKNNPKPEGAQRGYENYSHRPPFLAGVISSEALPRVFRILNALYREVESLGGRVNDDLSLQIRNEHVTLDVVEAQDKIDHIITKQEARQILEYEDAKRHHTWASQPNIRKYDYVFNGRLRICIRQGRYFRDTDKIAIETRLGDMLTELYEESEVVRQEREAQEEAVRKRKEEERLREEWRSRYNVEVNQTKALTNAARDYEIASRIRAYVATVEAADCMDEKTATWVDWAKKKADWFDPVVARVDELFGKREHEKGEEEKALKRIGGYW